MAKSKHSKDKFYDNALLLVCIVVIIYCCSVMGRWAYQNVQERKNQEMLLEIAQTASNEMTYDENVDNVNEKHVNIIYDTNRSKINFKALEEINKDIIAWIKIPMIDLSTPIVQTTDNNYYLSKNFYKEDNKCGCLFMDYRNNANWNDGNSIIYGHNLVSGMMFGDLKKIYDGEVGTNISIYISTKDKNSTYQMFSMYKVKASYSLDFNHVNIKELIEKSEIECNKIPPEQAKIISLVTCDGSGNGRLILHGYLK